MDKSLDISKVVLGVIDEMLEGFQVISNDWHYLYVNETVAKQGKKPKEELLGKTMMESYPGIDQTFLFTQLRKSKEEKISIQMENEFTYPDGSKGWFQLFIHPVEVGLVILSVDITDRKMAEAKLADKLEQISELGDIAMDCEEKMLRVKDLLANVEKFVPQVKTTGVQI